jgi:hypothetical protein
MANVREANMKCAAFVLPWLLLAIYPVAAQDSPNGLDIVVYNEVSPEQPVARVEVWARFDPQYFALARAAFQLQVANGQDFNGEWSIVEALDGPWTSAGEIDGKWSHRIDGIMPTQMHMHPVMGDDSNPILVWTGLYSTEDFTQRDLRLRLPYTIMFDVYATNDWYIPNIKRLPLEEIESGEAFVRITPDGCWADFDDNGTLDLFDFLAFINLFAVDHYGSDCDANNDLDLFDYLCFNNAFNEGC